MHALQLHKVPRATALSIFVVSSRCLAAAQAELRCLSSRDAIGCYVMYVTVYTIDANGGGGRGHVLHCMRED